MSVLPQVHIDCSISAHMLPMHNCMLDNICMIDDQVSCLLIVHDEQNSMNNWDTLCRYGHFYGVPLIPCCLTIVYFTWLPANRLMISKLVIISLSIWSLALNFCGSLEVLKNSQEHETVLLQ